MALPRNDVKKGIAVARVKRPLILAPAGARRGEGLGGTATRGITTPT